MGEKIMMPAGGLPSAAKTLLVPENIRAGVHIKGGGVDVTGECTTVGLLTIYNYGSYKNYFEPVLFAKSAENVFTAKRGVKGCFTLEGFARVNSGSAKIAATISINDATAFSATGWSYGPDTAIGYRKSEVIRINIGDIVKFNYSVSGGAAAYPLVVCSFILD